MAAPRLPRLFVAGLTVLLLLWVAALGVLVRGRGQSPFPASETIDPRFSARPGVTLARAGLAAGRLDATLDRLAAQGITYVRFTLPWDEIEAVQGQFTWAAWDRVAQAFARRPALQPVVVLDRSPAWARDPVDANNPLAPPHQRSDFGAFARAVAERYRDVFTYYQVWDEPNIAPHWGAKSADPQDYLGVLREAAVNIRAADPDARILAAALAPTTEDGGANLSDITYLDRLYGLGGRAWFDYPAVQPYGFSDSPDRAPDPARLDFSRAGLLRQVMLRHADGATPLWATAFGWDARTGGGSGEQGGDFGNVTEAQQAAYTAGAFERAARDWPWLGPLIWTGRFGMAPPAAEVLARAAAPPPVLGPGRYGTETPALHYRGWRVTPSAADPSAEGDSIAFDFNGTGAALEIQGGPYWAYLTVSVDGGPANRLPRDESGASYLVLNDPGAARRLVPVAEGLPAGQHSVRLVAHGGWGQWPLAAVVISASAASGARASGLGLALLALALIASVVTGLGWLRWQQARLASAATGGPRGPSRLVEHAEPAVIPARSVRIAGAAVWVLAIGLCALYLLSNSGPVNFVVLVLLGLLFLARPDLAPPLIAASLPWWQRTQPVLRWQFGLFEALAWIALLAWMGRGVFAWLIHRAPSPRPNPGWDGRSTRSGMALAIDISLLTLFAAGLLTTIFAVEQGVAWREFRIVFLFGLVLYFLITRASDGALRDRAAALVGGLLAGATIASLAGLWQFVTGQGRVDVEGVGRIAAFYGSPNNLALILDRAVPLATALALFGVAFWYPRTRWAVLLRGLLSAVALITLAAAIATFSKGAILLGLPAGLAVVLLGGAWRSGRRWPLWLLLAFGVVAALALVVLFRTPRFAGLFDFEGGTSFFRIKLWRGALNMALDHPLLGVGPDNFLYAYRTRYVLPSGWQELNLSHPHNILLDLWTRLGLVGVAAGLGALVVAFVAGWRLFSSGRRLDHEEARVAEDAKHEGRGDLHASGSFAPWPLMLGLLGGLAAAVAHGLIDNSLFLPDLMGWFVAAQAIFWMYAFGPADNQANP
ncbi:MAG: O-antigen ligase family protein [Nitrososphaerales archaeon]